MEDSPSAATNARSAVFTTAFARLGAELALTRSPHSAPRSPSPSSSSILFGVGPAARAVPSPTAEPQTLTQSWAMPNISHTSPTPCLVPPALFFPPSALLPHRPSRPGCARTKVPARRDSIPSLPLHSLVRLPKVPVRLRERAWPTEQASGTTLRCSRQ
ncbi:hypothetical protein ACCO45_007164 [Purpureocillium lilacinum]|uniref:Uncharacterized protein n=1 Tax=Purpureocillium lilacinum TaxID=33203 RepID=A0ACC4DRM0_PURLI